MSNENIVQDVIDDLKEVVQSIARLNQKTIAVLSAEELLDKTKLVAKPAAGVVYEGMRAIAEQGHATQKTGSSAESVFTVLILAEGASLNTPAEKANNIQLLGQLRKALRGRKSPTGHVYRFMVESPADEKSGMIIWAQRWAVPIPMI